MGGQAVVEGVMMRGASHLGGRGAHARGRDRGRRPTTRPTGRSSGRRSRSCAASWRSAESLALGLQGAHLVGRTARSPRRSRSPPRRWAGRWRSRSIVLHRRSSSCCPTLAANGLGRRPRPRRLLVPRRSRARCASGSSSATSLLIGQLQGHQARLPVPRRRAQGDRRLRERRRAHARVGAAVRHRSTCAAAPTSCSR